MEYDVNEILEKQVFEKAFKGYYFTADEKAFLKKELRKLAVNIYNKMAKFGIFIPPSDKTFQPDEINVRGFLELRKTVNYLIKAEMLNKARIINRIFKHENFKDIDIDWYLERWVCEHIKVYFLRECLGQIKHSLENL